VAAAEAPAGLLRRLLGGAPLRPPGARPEAEFAGLCIRCGRCAEVCPYRSLRPGGFGLGLEAGTPVVVAREAPCWLCMRCPPACPSGALAPIRDPRHVRMGLAAVDRDRCFAFAGIVCRTCLDACPLQGEAIRQDDDLRPVVTDRCAGCGLCEHRCPAPGSAIRVLPEAIARRDSAPPGVVPSPLPGSAP
jgi:MauM/NapG family ferredoxin protein